VAAIVALLLAALVFSAGRGLPGPTLHPGFLAYTRSPVGPWSPGLAALYFADPDGGNERVIRSGIDGGGQWSVTGRYVLAVNATPDPNLTIHVLDASGAEVGVIDAGENADMLWSPVADELLVVTQDPVAGAHLRLFAPDGSLIRTLMTPPGVTTIVNGVDWAPDGSRIVIAGCIACHDSKYDDTPDQVRHLWIVEADGSGATRLTDKSDRFEVAPRWSPDGRSIAFWESCSVDATCGASETTWRISPDGADRRPLVNGLGALWSPDGARLIFQRGEPDASLLYTVDFHLFVADADGSREMRITSGPGIDTPLAWSRDGRQIFYSHQDRIDPNVTTEVPVQTWIADADGHRPVLLGTGINGLDQQFTR